jgi:hypothetical protein
MNRGKTKPTKNPSHGSSGTVHGRGYTKVWSLPCPPNTDPHDKLEWWIEGRQDNERERFKPDQIIGKLREAKVPLSAIYCHLTASTDLFDLNSINKYFLGPATTEPPRIKSGKNWHELIPPSYPGGPASRAASTGATPCRWASASKGAAWRTAGPAWKKCGCPPAADSPGPR